jgi:hypothetical protein
MNKTEIEGKKKNTRTKIEEDPNTKDTPLNKDPNRNRYMINHLYASNDLKVVAT